MVSAQALVEAWACWSAARLVCPSVTASEQVLEMLCASSAQKSQSDEAMVCSLVLKSDSKTDELSEMQKGNKMALKRGQGSEAPGHHTGTKEKS